MSLETQRRLILSEWRRVLVSQTSYPLMYKIERAPQSEEELQWFSAKYAIVKIPLGNRIITKWQEQVRPIDNDDDQWYVVREWTEAEMSRDYNKAEDNTDREATTTCVKDRTQIQRILAEVGLNPSEYIYSPTPEDNPPQEPTSNHTSAFASYPSQQTQDNRYRLEPQSQTLLSSGRSLSYVQQPPPPPPPQPSTNQPPPAEKEPVPPITQASNNQLLGPPPSSSQPSQVLSSLLNRGTSNTRNTTSQAPGDMSEHAFSPRRLPPSPPLHFSSHCHDSNLTAEHYLREINSQECPPVKVVKPNKQNVVYRKEIRIRYLQPPTPPPPAPIIIREKRIPPAPPQSPLLIRERKPEARTPPPLTIRERPPTPPPPLEPCIIDKNIPPPPPQPRQIIIERLPTPPPKPRTVIFEKWLPYKKLKRPVLLQKAPPPEPIKPTRNVIIEYEPLKAFTVRRVIEEGVFRVNPHEYSSYNAKSHSGCGDVRIVERIEDLPPPSEHLRRVLLDCDHSNPSRHTHSHDHHSHHNVSEHIPSSIQHLLGGGRSTSNMDHLTNISRSSSIPANRQERVLSTGCDSSTATPTIIPLKRSGSKHSHHRIQQKCDSHDSPTRSQVNDIY
ncbi:unnamed protein product [Rotaria sp. Silwood1]|nr:unnamed protein product [Rotaria sp. Silwood1]CAF0739510.1 unnamed protein product [Rotaria sp. Silwood1]CAF3349402.1 unnamed protein product [Rotaria sp. Silwood1]CAF3354290.1 unnamed protein product [Rotaria sp. Silwood1]CAF4576455.1 unnamed protein product [Rotaria sp. Silwood1]